MKEESLIQAYYKIYETIDKSTIDDLDKIELLMNLRLFLEPQEYDNNIKVLNKNIRRQNVSNRYFKGN